MKEGEESISKYETKSTHANEIPPHNEKISSSSSNIQDVNYDQQINDRQVIATEKTSIPHHYSSQSSSLHSFHPYQSRSSSLSTTNSIFIGSPETGLLHHGMKLVRRKTGFEKLKDSSNHFTLEESSEHRNDNFRSLASSLSSSSLPVSLPSHSRELLSLPPISSLLSTCDLEESLPSYTFPESSSIAPPQPPPLPMSINTIIERSETQSRMSINNLLK